MPTLDIDVYKIDFLILPTNDPKIIVLLDRSNYLTNPEKPRLEITLPGYTGHIEVPYNIGGLTVIDSDLLKLTESCEYNTLVDLPDGIYHIKQKVCPYDELFVSKCYLHSAELEGKFNQALLKIDDVPEYGDKKGLISELVNFEILLKSAKAEIIYCNAQKAAEKYKLANNKITKLLNNLNYCN